ncbi:MAG TPA: glycosyltransferase family 4 protein [Longimicrobiales bacterium]|nr:glycosyltransferase family 4 protein [Longimicrobiales bacterium]
MKIAVVSTPFVPVPPKDYGGTELVVHELVEGLVARGHDVTLYATGDSTTSAAMEYLYEEAQWPPEPLADLNHASWALSRVRDAGFDVVHVHSAEALGVSRMLRGIPVVYTLHHEREEVCSRYYPYFPEVWFVAISERQRQREVRLPRITTIYHGLEPSYYAGPTTAGDYVCFIGRLSKVKGPHHAIDAAVRAGIEIRVAGRNHADDRVPGFFEREVEPRLKHPLVRYLGGIGGADKAALLRGARAVLVPIEWEEPFGLVMIEAMLSGCPVIAFPRGSAPELVEDGRTGFLVRDVAEMAHAILHKVEGFDREACRARAIERFSRDAMVERYEAQYLTACGQGSARCDPHAPAFP